MKKTTKIATLVFTAVMLGMMGQQFVHGQDIDIVGLQLNTDQVIFIIIIGAVGGVIKAWQGYDKSPNDFDTVRFIGTVRDSILISIPVAFTYVLALPELNAVGYVLTFGSVIGFTELIGSARKKSIPSNATEDEINDILNGRG